MKLNLLRECLLKDANNRKTLNMHQFPYLVWGRGALCVARPGLCLPHHLPACGLPGLRLEWVHAKQTEPGTLQIWEMLARPFRPTASAGDPGRPSHSGRAGKLDQDFSMAWLSV